MWCKTNGTLLAKIKTLSSTAQLSHTITRSPNYLLSTIKYRVRQRLRRLTILSSLEALIPTLTQVMWARNYPIIWLTYRSFSPPCWSMLIIVIIIYNFRKRLSIMRRTTINIGLIRYGFIFWKYILFKGMLMRIHNTNSNSKKKLVLLNTTHRNATWKIWKASIWCNRLKWKTTLFIKALWPQKPWKSMSITRMRPNKILMLMLFDHLYI